ncbi:rRNA maturation RNase YbeY [Cellulophaga baltica]|uniref:rRNA maturation RNase YbeY n=1 Tax=Cellulophaga TaxID=104264 RepID=UPI001C06A94E|nr:MULTISPECIES: rRNA maturation RNase YbeY [Cellulophaga]MBU2995906.1 rRNA maturation RNase YbeY [Cellulophaga baltica]MDO6767301.1 rRNA maturation RNase YbeY [Cellulophaga sp. 1_MG-2023]
MIEFNYETDFKLNSEDKNISWIQEIISSEGKTEGDVSFIFCNDKYLLDINQRYLDHDTYTDIITFDYCEGDLISSDIFISVERVEENSKIFNVSFDKEMSRVMAHGVLHLIGYNDKTDEQSVEMKKKEEEKIKMFHVEH